MDQVDVVVVVRHNRLLLLLLLLLELRLVHLLPSLRRITPQLSLLAREDLLLLGPLDVRVGLDVSVDLGVRVDRPLADVRTSDQMDIVENCIWK